MRYCTKCGSPIVPGALFCTECGSPQSAATEQGTDSFGGQADAGQNSQYRTTQTYEQPQGAPYDEPYRQQGTRGLGTNRSIVVCVILSLVTCGIYSLFWLVVLNDDINLLSDEPSPTDGVMVIILSFVTCGIYGLYWYYKMGNAVDRIKQSGGNTGILYLILALFGVGIVNLCLMQDTVNNA